MGEAAAKAVARVRAAAPLACDTSDRIRRRWGMQRSLSAAAMPRTEVTPLACSSAMTGARSATLWSASA
jgi:hypothetical protein